VSYVEKSNVVIIDYKNSIKQIAEPIDPEAVVRKGRSIREPIIRKFDLSSGDTAETHSGYLKSMTNGTKSELGTVPSDILKNVLWL